VTFLTWHIIGATLGQGLALVAGVVALLYLWQRHMLKQKRFTAFSARLPALDQLEKILHFCLWAGFIFISLAMASGGYYFFRQGRFSALGVEKFIWASTVWLWYLGTLIMKSVYAQPSRRIAKMSVIGFLLLSVAVYGLLFIIIR
jgi:ABC-type uncharacterized transport system permease subunit